MKKKYLFLLCIVALVLSISYLLPIRYTIMATDDYAYYMNLKDLALSNNLFVAAFQAAKNYYLTWQGTFSSVYLTYLFMMIANGNLTILHIELCIVILTLLIALFLLAQELNLLLFQKEDWGKTVFLYIVFLLLGMNHQSPNEAMYWFNGAFVNTSMLGVGLLAICLLLRYYRLGGTYRIVMSCIFAFLSAQGPLTIAGFMNAFLLGLCGLLYLKGDKKRGTLLLPFLFCFIAALINALAPGNYLRQGQYDGSGLFVTDAFFNTFYALVVRIGVLLHNSYLLLGMSLLILFIFKNKERLKVPFSIHPFILWVYSFFILFCTMFPYCLGYHTRTMIVSRQCFFMELYTVILFIPLTIYTALYYKNRQWVNKRIISILLAILCVGNLLWVKPDVILLPKLIQQYWDGTMKVFHEDSMRLIDKIKNDKEDIVIIEEEVPFSYLLQGLTFVEDSGSWYNDSVAKYLGKEAIIYQPK